MKSRKGKEGLNEERKMGQGRGEEKSTFAFCVNVKRDSNIKKKADLCGTQHYAAMLSSQGGSKLFFTFPFSLSGYRTTASLVALAEKARTHAHRRRRDVEPGWSASLSCNTIEKQHYYCLAA